MGVLLYILAKLLSVVILPIGYVYGLFRDFLNISKKFMFIAISLDMTANVICSELFNDIFITSKSKNKFGLIKQTISEALAINSQMLTLTKLGVILGNYLNYIDPFHLEKSIGMSVPNVTISFYEKIKRVILTIFIFILLTFTLLSIFFLIYKMIICLL